MGDFGSGFSDYDESICLLYEGGGIFMLFVNFSVSLRMCYTWSNLNPLVKFLYFLNNALARSYCKKI